MEIFICFESDERTRMMQELSLIQTELKTDDDTTTKVKSEREGRGGGGRERRYRTREYLIDIKMKTEGVLIFL